MSHFRDYNRKIKEQNINTIVPDEKFDFLVNGISRKSNAKNIIKQTGLNIVNSSFGE